MQKDKLIKMLIGFLPLLLLFLDPPEGMDPKAWGLFPFYAGAILMVMLRPVGEATALAIFLGLYAVIMRGHTVALSGFALTMTWLVVGAYIIAQAFRDTNLGKRISFWMIRIFGRSTLGLGYAAAFADFIIAPVTPSNAARTGGIIYPIFLSVAESLGSYPDKNPRGFGAYISVLLYGPCVPASPSSQGMPPIPSLGRWLIKCWDCTSLGSNGRLHLFCPRASCC